MEGGPVPAEAGEAEQVGPPGKRRGCPSDPRCSNPHMRHKQRMGLSVISFAAGRPNMWADLLVKGRHASLLAIRSGDSEAANLSPADGRRTGGLDTPLESSWERRGCLTDEGPL